MAASANSLTPEQHTEIEGALPSGEPFVKEIKPGQIVGRPSDETFIEEMMAADQAFNDRPDPAYGDIGPHGYAFRTMAAGTPTTFTLPATGPYGALAAVLFAAFEQAANGKGKERHASGDTPFEEQPMASINRQLGSIDGFIYQAHKKSLEAKRLPDGRAQAELLGAINYLAGAVIALDTWAQPAPSSTVAEFMAQHAEADRLHRLAAAIAKKQKEST
jgi:hypothetical protein